MDKNDIDYINAELRGREWIKLTKDVLYPEGSTCYSGKFEINTEKGILHFDVDIQPDFPLGKIDFICTSHRGYSHMMHYGHICLNTGPAIGIRGRLNTELDKLQLWVEKYFINEERDTHFEYYHFAVQHNITMFFEETSDKEPIPTEYGKFEYAELNNFKLGEDVRHSWMALTLGGRKCRWASTFTKRFSKKYTGLWVLLDSHPVIDRRHSIEDWKDLLTLLSSRQSKFLSDTYRSLKGQSAYTDSFILMIGYHIPDGTQPEVHWDTIIIRFDDFPFTPVKIAPGTYGPEDKGQKVAWAKSVNASYQRVFGRGKLSDALTEKKVLIIGTGAIGSQLFEILVRGGCRHIEISEPDIIEPGNVCRGNFSFLHSQKPKLFELYNEALSISPYIDITVSPGIPILSSDNALYAPQKQKLQNFDFIFDCSTDKYLAIMLDGMQLNGQIINLSISNEANHMTAITGIGNIHITKSMLYDRLVPQSREPFFVATGCWHPTFRASYADISVLLGYVISEINHKMETIQVIRSFYVNKGVGKNMALTYQLSYDV